MRTLEQKLLLKGWAHEFKSFHFEYIKQRKRDKNWLAIKFLEQKDEEMLEHGVIRDYYNLEISYRYGNRFFTKKFPK